MSINDNCTSPECMQRVNHIRCDVKNCAYHSENDSCHAEMIHVKPMTASSCCTDEKDTACETFIEKR